jgi:hypothetical protein
VGIWDYLAAIGGNESKTLGLASQGMERMAAPVAKGVADLVTTPARQMQPNPYPAGSEEASWYADNNARQAYGWGPEMALNMLGVGGSSAMLGATPRAAGEVTLGIVPVDVGKNLNVPKNLPQTDAFATAVKNTKGASVQDGSLVVPVVRNQHPDQELTESLRGGVFYLPQGSKDAKYYTGTGHNTGYGGTEKISGETAVNNPLFVKGATGGKAPETAYDQLIGKGAYQKMRNDAVNSTAYYLSHDDKVHLAERFFQQYAPEMVDLADHVVRNTKKGNQFAYALQEAAVASAARKAGHDSVVGYSVSRKTKEPFISELFDVRENLYPSKAGDYQMWPQFKIP